MQHSLAGKGILITGAARGIGAETARQLAARGARLALVGMEPELLATVCADVGDGHHWFPCDVTDQEGLDRAVSRGVAALGRLDVVVANAGIACRGTVAVAPVEALVKVLEVNLGGLVRTVSATLPHLMASRGYYLLVSSAAAFAPMPGMSTYAASKAGVEQFGNILRLEVAHTGVGVGVVYPCWIDTDLVRDTQRDMPSFRDALPRLPGPLGRVTSVEECAAAFVAGIERRARKVYIPRSLSVFAAMRQFLSSALVERVVRRDAPRMITTAEAEVRSHGRFFGEHSVALDESERSTEARGTSGL